MKNNILAFGTGFIAFIFIGFIFFSQTSYAEISNNWDVSWKVDLRPQLPAGNYVIVRSIEIDPNEVWIDYGQEIVGKLIVSESNNKPFVNLKVIDFEDKERLEGNVSKASEEKPIQILDQQEQHQFLDCEIVKVQRKLDCIAYY